MDFISQNIPTIVVGLIVFFVVFLAARKMYKDKKSGNHSCSGCKGCSGDCDHK